LKALLETGFSNLTLFARGKVRDVYSVGDNLLMVTTDRISAFDHILGTGIPDKGKILTQLSMFWFDLLRDETPNHVVTANLLEFPEKVWEHREVLKDRALLVRRATMFPVECVARGFLAGSGWRDYKEKGSVCGLKLPGGLRESSRLKEPIFTPATKSEQGIHDENISFDRMVEIVGAEAAEHLRETTMRLYARAAVHAERQGIILADTKFEFGVVDGQIVLADEALTPDSSRFWARDEYRPGRPQPSYDKQYVRDYLESIQWNKQPPVPYLPELVVRQTRSKYVEAFRLLTGRPLAL
jgi:phosphoribosylaminoimidazole-succinocarboxamide synthase